MDTNENAVMDTVAETPAAEAVAAAPVVVETPAAPVKPAKAKSKAKSKAKAQTPKAKVAPKAKAAPKAKVARGVGRPRCKVALPPGNFTFNALAIHNGVMDSDGNMLPKGKRRMCILTLRNFIKKDKNLGESSVLVVRADKTEEPKGGKLGRKRFVFSRRSAVKNAALIVAQNSPVTVTAADAPAATVETAVAA